MYKPITAEEFAERSKARRADTVNNLRDLASFLEQHPEIICDKVEIETDQTFEIISFKGSFLVHRPSLKAQAEAEEDYLAGVSPASFTGEEIENGSACGPHGGCG